MCYGNCERQKQPQRLGRSHHLATLFIPGVLIALATLLFIPDPLLLPLLDARAGPSKNLRNERQLSSQTVTSPSRDIRTEPVVEALGYAQHSLYMTAKDAS